MRLQRRSFLLGSGASLLAAAAGAQESRDGAYMALWATTQSMVVPGLDGGLPPGLDLNSLPPAARAQIEGLLGPKKLLEVRLWSPGAAPANAKANLDIPAALQLGETLPLDISRPEQRKPEATQAPKEFRLADDFEIRLYWGCSESVAAGQPKVMNLSTLTGPEREAWKRAANQGAGYVEKPDWTQAVWPNAKQAQGGRPGAPNFGGPPKAGSLKGGYTLKTSYLGQAPFTVTQADFLDAVVFTSPGKDINLKRAIPLAWKPIPTALGLHLFAVAMKDSKTLIMWSAGPNSGGTAAAPSFPSMAEVKEMVEKGVFLRPEVGTCSIPAGIFDGTQAAMLQMIAYGPGQAFESPNAPNIRVQTRSMGMLPLGAGFGR